MPHFRLLSGNVGFFDWLNATMPMYEKSFQPKEKKMNTRNLLVSVLMLMCVLLSACAPAVTATQVPTSLPPTAAPTAIPPTQARVVNDSVVDLDQVADISDGVETIPVDLFNDRVPLVAFDSIWFLSTEDGKVTRWDPETHQILATMEVGDPNKTPYGDPVAAVATSDAIWITSVATHEIVKVDPPTNQIVDRITLPKANGDQDFLTWNMVLVGNTAWVWDYDKKFAQGIDLNTKQVVGTFENVNSISSFDGSLWISDSKGATQMDPETNQAVKQLPPYSPLPIMSTDGSLWGFKGSSVRRMDSETSQVIANINLGNPVRDMKFANGSLWVTVSAGPPPACHNGSYLVQIDPKTNTVVGKIALDCPFDILPYKDSLWVAGADEGDATHLLLTHIQP
jgi:streptogramin lyase